MKIFEVADIKWDRVLRIDEVGGLKTPQGREHSLIINYHSQQMTQFGSLNSILLSQLVLISNKTPPRPRSKADIKWEAGQAHLAGVQRTQGDVLEAFKILADRVNLPINLPATIKSWIARTYSESRTPSIHEWTA